METITLIIDRYDVYEEVAKTTDYTGSKMDNTDDTTRDRILSTDDDLTTLTRFWEESVAIANDRLKAMFINGSSPQDTPYEVTLEVSKSFDKALVPSIQAALRCYFVMSIVGKWYNFANKSESESYFKEAGVMIEDVLRKLYSRMKPKKPIK